MHILILLRIEIKEKKKKAFRFALTVWVKRFNWHISCRAQCGSQKRIYFLLYFYNALSSCQLRKFTIVSLHWAVIKKFPFFFFAQTKSFWTYFIRFLFYFYFCACVCVCALKWNCNSLNPTKRNFIIKNLNEF